MKAKKLVYMHKDIEESRNNNDVVGLAIHTEMGYLYKAAFRTARGSRRFGIYI
jgi:hypothetical protein